VIPQTWLYRHDELAVPRPYGLDGAADEWLWEGTTANRLMGHHLRTGELRVLEVPEMDGKVVYSVFAWRGGLLLELGHAPFYLFLDPESGDCVRRPLGGDNPITWYGARLPGDRVAMFDRGQRRVLVLDSPEAEPRAVPCPFEGDLSGGRVLGDGLLYSILGDPARVVRFDPGEERFLDERPLPWPEIGVTGGLEHEGVWYCADCAGGRILAMELESGRWLEPVPHPDHGRVFGYIGGGFGFEGRAWFCLSTYMHRSRLDTGTGKIILPEGPLTLDGRTPRFLERMLVFDPETRTFDYLVAPEQPDGVPLLCYHWTDGRRFAVTGMMIPFDENGEPGEHVGPWLVLQSEPTQPACSGGSCEPGRKGDGR